MAYLDDAGHRLVSDAVAEAEAKTSGEIVTVLTERSDGYTDVALLWAIGAAFTAMSVFAAFPQPFLDAWDASFGGWGHQWSTGELASMVIALGLIKFVAVMLVQQWDPLKFWLIPGPTKTIRVHNQAVRQFKVGADRRTTGRTGVLIYLSMAEHRAEIVADESIAAIVPAEVWGEAMGDMLSHIRKGAIAEGLAAGIRDVGFVLAEHFPRGENDVNELPDRLIEV
ncbi:MAG TPA: TPM domain-containing protein [Erythrobacter sp.]|nr:TPM domain-containing protein [Erythrobacter sp.]